MSMYQAMIQGIQRFGRNKIVASIQILLLNCVYICLYSQVYAGAIVMLTGVHTCEKV